MTITFLIDSGGYEKGDTVELPEEAAKELIAKGIVQEYQVPQSPKKSRK